MIKKIIKSRFIPLTRIYKKFNNREMQNRKNISKEQQILMKE